MLYMIKYSRRQTIYFSEAVGKRDMFCFSVASDFASESHRKQVSISVRLMRLPFGVSSVTVLFRAQLGYPAYSNTF